MFELDKVVSNQQNVDIISRLQSKLHVNNTCTSPINFKAEENKAHFIRGDTNDQTSPLATGKRWWTSNEQGEQIFPYK
jgi:hypothetical protein